LLNLLSNACKFTSQGSVTLSVERVTGTDGDAIRFCVTDTGIGMTQEQVEKIFRPFQQADSSIEQRFGGTGLGLAITRQMARLMDGDVTVESVAGMGTRVTMTINADLKSPDQFESEIEPLVGDPDQPFVLVIEDEADARDLVTRSLTPVGFSVQCASTARAGHKALTMRIPALIVLDICLPDASGWAFLDQVKRDKSLGNIPVVVLSTDDDRARSIALGAAEHIVKPVTRDALAATVVRLARNRIGEEPAEQRQAA
jgi:CheY-like chemotaxis protein/anti-sigma regulatory factor (Ser/Thr protein kinase)